MATRWSTASIAACCLVALACRAQPLPPPPRPVPPTEPPPAAPLELRTPARPALSVTDGITVRVERFSVSGATRIGSEEIAEALQPFVQRTLRFGELAQAADAVTALYRRRGFLLALAYLPEQEIRDGNVEIAVLEGRLGTLQLGAVPPGVDRDAAQAVATRGLVDGAVLGEANLVRNLLLLNEWPGVAASAEVRPGSQVGSADVGVDLRETAPRASGVVTLDNHGGRATGRARLGAAATVRQPAGRGDLLTLQGTLSEQRGLLSLQAGYALPVHASGTRLGVAVSWLEYRVTDPAFAALAARGDASYFQLTLDQPLLRRVGHALTLRTGAAHKDLSDRVEAFAQFEDRHVDTLQLALRGDQQDRAPEGAAPFAATGSTRYSLAVTAGRVSYDDSVAGAADALQRATAGTFGRINLDLAREQPLGASFALAVRLAVQRALRRNLDNAERAVLGGANALRGYGELATLADQTELGTLELHHRTTLGSVGLDTAMYFDLGHGRADRISGTAGNTALRSKLLGLGAEAALPGELTLRLAATRQTLEPPLPDRQRWVNRGWLEIVKAF